MFIENSTLFEMQLYMKLIKKTSLWYDEIGLLKSDYIEKNGYCYYSYKQSTELETILILRELNVSIDISKVLPIEKGITETKKHQLRRLYDAFYRAMISVKIYIRKNLITIT